MTCRGFRPIFSRMAPVDLKEEILRLKKERNAIILAHSYQTADIQDIADFVGDSLGLAYKAQSTDCRVIAFCGVHFMAETAKILNPDKTVVLPDAGLKIFLSASAECRAQRRYRQLQEKGIEEPYADVLRELEQRDYDDTHRAVAPLKAAPDAVHIDTSDLTLDESIDAVCAAIRTRFGVEGKA